MWLDTQGRCGGSPPGQPIGEYPHPAFRVTGDGMGWGVDNFFWGAVSLALLGVLVGLLVLMLTMDLHQAMGHRRH
jgi:hypothetical protein